MNNAKKQMVSFEQQARMAEAKSAALDNRIPLHWFRLAHGLLVGGSSCDFVML
jgi:hypothetical protein